jgi:hypothetical protein
VVWCSVRGAGDEGTGMRDTSAPSRHFQRRHMRTKAGKFVVTSYCISPARQRLVAGVGETVSASSEELEQLCTCRSQKSSRAACIKEREM